MATGEVVPCDLVTQGEACRYQWCRYVLVSLNVASHLTVDMVTIQLKPSENSSEFKKVLLYKNNTAAFSSLFLVTLDYVAE